jgi:hypothetical protein
MTITYQNVEVSQPQAENYWLAINDSWCGSLAVRSTIPGVAV